MSVLLVRWRRVLALYLGFVAMLGSSCAVAASGAGHVAIIASFAVALVAALILLAFSVMLHKAIRVVSPGARSIGPKQTIISAVLFTPFEAALFIPPVNLIVGRKVLSETQLCVPADAPASRVFPRACGPRRG